MNKLLTNIAKILTNVFVILFGIILVGNTIAMANVDAINSFLGEKTFEVVEKEEGADANADLKYFKSEFNSVKDSKANGEKLTQEVTGEGVVLLKNENNALPLASGKRNVSLFSISSVSYITAGTGSSGTNKNVPVSLQDALKDSGFTVNTALWDWYNNNQSTYGRGGSGTGGAIGASFRINEAPWSALPDAKTNKADAAIFILARTGGEGSDLTISSNYTDMTNGNYLQLSPEEIDVLTNLKALKDSGTFSNIIVIMNTANPVQCDFVDNAAYGIDAMMWIGDPGTTGIKAVAKILAGDINPSGRTSDTFFKEHYLNPVYANFGTYVWTNGNVTGMRNLNNYLVYQEGIYNGYRYTETRYEDVVLGTANVGSFNYNDVVSYPFGYGLSYTTFEYSNVHVTAPLRGASNYTVTATVTNTGKTAGKEVVQVYVQKPYTDYDKQNGIEKSAVDLVGFTKTGVIQPNGSETVTVEVDEKYFASYDATKAKTYVIDAGDYYLTVAKDAHDATNNILAAKGYTTSNKMTANGNSAMTAKFTKTFDSTTYSKNPVTGAKITNKFDDANLNLYSGKGSNSVTYMTRSNWSGTVSLGYSATYEKLGTEVKVAYTEQMVTDGTMPVPQKDSTAYPTYGSKKTAYQLIDLRADENGNPIPYDSPLWNDLLDQLTWEETTELLTHGLRMTYVVESIGKPQTIEHNGATGPVQPYNDNAKINRGLALEKDDPDKAETPTIYPCNGLLASTFNQELIEKMGVAMGNDCLWSGYNGIYGFGSNTHRGVYGGRAFEYYSEDGFLAGKIGAAEVRGVQSKGVQVYMKHCFLNDQESARSGVATWANEQTLREIYLLAFEIPIEEANAYNVMSGFNRLGMKWTGHHGFLNTVLRDEFGMKGIAVTDWYSRTYMTCPGGVLTGSDLPDGTAAGVFNDYKEGYGDLAWAMRESAHRILYMHAQGNAMNNLSANMRIVILTPGWIIAINAVTIVLGILMGGSAIFFGVMIYLDKRNSQA